ncbi:MAG: polyprenyl synthetase family protein [Deltaproteobacteria bacterium]|nr:polyprenyl synthetase family protein [Deltaproteobacteria bacterium]
MNLDEYLKRKRGEVDKALDDFLPGEEEFPQSLHRAMRYSVFAGGKRIRPILVVASAEAVGGDASKVIHVACGMEFIHTYSLIHDDLPAIDNDDFRRGKPTSHKVFGEATAILAGDALLTLAFEIMARTPVGDGRETSTLLKVIQEVARAAGSTGMAGGQEVDIETQIDDVTFPILEYIHIHKTGALILACVRAGAILSVANGRKLEALTRYGESIGLAFQIADDILDVEGNPDVLGKFIGGDAKKGKATYPAFLSLDESKKRARELVNIAISSIEGLDRRADPLRGIARYIIERKS